MNRAMPFRRARSLVPRALLAGLALLLALVPLGLVASDRFTDVPSRHPYHDDIDAIADAGILASCNSPANTKFCPADKVTRDALAGALARTAGLGGHPPVANAQTAQTAAQAADAATLGGYEASGLVRVAGGSTQDVLLGGAWVPVSTITIEAPSSGFVLLTGSVAAAIAADWACPCLVDVQAWHLTAGTGGGTFSMGIAGGGAAESKASTAVTHLFPVSAGSHSFQIRGRLSSANAGGGVVAYADAAALFVPFGPNGAGRN